MDRFPFLVDSRLQNLRSSQVYRLRKPYFTVPNVRRQLYNAHHWRELQASLELDGEAWAGRMERLLTQANLAVRLPGN